jgi:4-hydroxybenzoate polyprenyltransferase
LTFCTTLAGALRVPQWAKNLLLFLPLALAHRLDQPSEVFITGRAFAAFCLLASAVYLINDVTDLAADALHPLKSQRPVASGELAVPVALVWAGALMGAALLLALPLPRVFLLTLGIYGVTTTLYSLRLKAEPILDIVLLAGLYTLRLFAGSAATGVRVSEWCLAFSIFFFLSLAAAKRVAELRNLEARGGVSAAGRGYHLGDVQLLEVLGVSSGMAAVVIYALYIYSGDLRALYGRPLWLWAVGPLLIYWIGRIWLLGHRGELHEDPVLFALRDRMSYAIGLLAALCVWAAI